MTDIDHGNLLNTALIALHAGTLNDIEGTRKGLGSRYGALTGQTPAGLPWKPDKDGEERSFGLPPDNPHALRFLSIFDALSAVEADAVKNLEVAMKAHPLSPWVKSKRGLGLKQTARLIAAIGDPYWRPQIDTYEETGEKDAKGKKIFRLVSSQPEGPRTVSALWAYSGLHVRTDEQGVGTAVRRQSGVKSNWSTDAKTRSYLIATSCLKQIDRPCGAYEGESWATHEPECACSPYRLAYDRRKSHTAKTWAEREDMIDARRHADALRVASKEILKDLWIEARRLHEVADAGQ